MVRFKLTFLMFLALSFLPAQAMGLPRGQQQVWQPRPGVLWQWQLSGAIDTGVAAQMFDIDLFDAPQETIAELHAQGRVVICYFSAGTWEDWRPDAADFPASVLGKPLPDWPGERWLDIRQLDILQPLQAARLDLAVQKGCDGVEPDNVDAYANDSGFALTAADQLVYNRWLAQAAHQRGLSVGLKNDLDQIPELVGDFDWALNESCFAYDECDALQLFISAGKAVFGVSYEGDPALICPQANARQLDWLFKHWELDAWRLACRQAYPAPPPAAVRLAIIGDYGSGNWAEARVADLVHSWGPDAVLTAGDNNYPNGAASTIDDHIGRYYHDFIAPYTGAYGPGAASNRFYPALGNHDWRSLSCAGATCSGPYFDYFTLPGNERYYDVLLGPVHVFLLDSDHHEPDGRGATSAQARWLQRALATSPAPWQIVILHHPPYSSAAHGSQSASQWPFAAWGADVVISGHDHSYERIARDGIIYFVNGLGGASPYNFDAPVAGSQVRYNKTYGAQLVQADASQLTISFININDVTVDSVTLSQNPPATATATPTPQTAPTATATPLPAATSTPTATATPAAKNTATPTATATPLPAATSTPTATPAPYLLRFPLLRHLYDCLHSAP